MSGQSTAAAERSYHAPAEREGTVSGPVVEVSPGVFQLRAIVERDAEIARLRRELGRAAEELRAAAALIQRMVAEGG